ncbi:MAG: hypothetical protein ACLU80_10100 [Dorea sp.]
MIIKDEELEEDRAKELAKAREKRQKKMIRTNMDRQPKRHTRQGLQSCMYCGVGGICAASHGDSVSFVLKGKVSILVGFADLVCACYGKRLGFVSGSDADLRNRDKNYHNM